MIVLDLLLLLVIAAVAWSLMREGLWGASLICVETVFAILIAFSFYMPIGMWIGRTVEFLDYFALFIPLAGLFCVVLTGLRILEMKLVPELVRFPYALHKFGGLAFGILTGWFVAGFMLCAAQTVPLSPTMGMGYYPDQRAFFGVGIDRQCLGLARHGYDTAFERSFDTEPLAARMLDPDVFVVGMYRVRTAVHMEMGGENPLDDLDAERQDRIEELVREVIEDPIVSPLAEDDG